MPNDEELSSDDAIWHIVLLLVTFLNLRFHLPHRGCNLILAVLKVVFISAGLISSNKKPASTLKTAFRTLGLEDRFEVFPMCPGCRRIYEDISEPNLRCSECDTPLFKTKEILKNDFDDSMDLEQHTTETPVLKFPYRSISSQLQDLLARPGIEDQIDSWRHRQRDDNRMEDIMDGEIWKTLMGSDGKPFFDNIPNRDAPDELRIAITLGFDG